MSFQGSRAPPSPRDCLSGKVPRLFWGKGATFVVARHLPSRCRWAFGGAPRTSFQSSRAPPSPLDRLSAPTSAAKLPSHQRLPGVSNTPPSSRASSRLGSLEPGKVPGLFWVCFGAIPLQSSPLGIRRGSGREFSRLKSASERSGSPLDHRGKGSTFVLARRLSSRRRSAFGGAPPRVSKAQERLRALWIASRPSRRSRNCHSINDFLVL